MRTAILLCFVTAGVSAQSFEVASVKPHDGPMPFSGVRTEGLRLRATTTLRGAIMWAYDLRNFQVEGATPDDFYDIDAKTAGEAIPSRAEFRAMLRGLLEDRFSLRTHREIREVPVYELVAGKSASAKLKPSQPDAESGNRVHTVGRNYELFMPKATMSEFVQYLDNVGFLDRPAVDRTGLTGNYRLELRYTPHFHGDDPENIDIATAVQSQLGLKLEPSKARMEMVVLDHWEKPARN